MRTEKDEGTTCAKNSKRNQSYSDKLKSPKWQKKRLEILSKRGFKCEVCGDEENQIQVHHRFYLKGREPWEYDNDVFQVLCEKCHENSHKKEQVVEIVKEIIPERYKELIKFLDGHSDRSVYFFTNGITSNLTDEYMEDFNDVMAYASENGFYEVFRNLIIDAHRETTEIQLHIEINHLTTIVKYLAEQAGIIKPENFDNPFIKPL